MQGSLTGKKSGDLKESRERIVRLFVVIEMKSTKLL